MLSVIYRHPRKARIVIFSFIYILTAFMLVFLYKNYEYNQQKNNVEMVLLSDIKEVKDVQIAYQNLELTYRLAFVKPKDEVLAAIDLSQRELNDALLDLGPMTQRSSEQLHRFEALKKALGEEMQTIGQISQWYRDGAGGPNRLFDLNESSIRNYHTITKTLNDMTTFERSILYAKIATHKNQDTDIIKVYLLVGFCFFMAMLPLILLVNHLILNSTNHKKLMKCVKEKQLIENDYEFFCYSISHDLRAPLRAIQGFANLLAEVGTSTEEKVRFISVITRESIKMSTLIDSLLEFTKTGRKDLKKTEIDTNKLVKDVIEALPELEKKVGFKIDSLPDINADYILITQVFHNLLENAVKFSQESDLPVVHVGFEHNAFFVADNGMGFSNKHAERIFDLFQRLYPEKSEGAGAGLSIAKKIIERHGGKIWAEGEPGVGATFYFKLP